MNKLENITAVVTGGGSGIGRATAELLAGDGAMVYILDVQEDEGRETESIITNKGHKARSIACDVSNHGETLESIEQIFAQEGRLDILINNAGITHIGTLETTSEADFDRIYQ